MLYFQQSGAAARGLVGYAAGQSYMQVRVNGATDFATGTMSTAFFSTGNVGINTTTDAGFKLDVNGTARIATSLVINGSSSLFSSALTIYQNGTNRICSLALSTTKTSATLTTHLSLNSSESTSPQSLDFVYSGAAAINNRYHLLQTSEVGVAYGGGIVLQKDGGWVSIGSSSNFNDATILALTSTTKGFLPPRMTTTQKNAIASPTAGLMVYDTTLNLISVYNGTTWITL
jgi:hypothetical protein